MPFDNRNINEEPSESFLNEFKEKMAIDPLSETVRHVNKNTSNKQAIIILVLIILAVCAGICWNFYSSYISGESEPAEIPVLKARTEPIKVRPTEPGGMPVRDMDKTAYMHVAKYPATGHSERIRPAEAKPVAPTPSDNKGYASDQPVQPTGISDAPSVPATEVARPVIPAQPIATPAPVPVPVVAPVPVAQPQTTSGTAQPTTPNQAAAADKKTSVTPVKSSAADVVAAAGKIAKETVKQQMASDSGKIAKETAKPKVAFTTAFQAQLVSVKSKDAALRGWHTALRRNKALLTGVDYEIVETTIPGKGAYYRLRVGNFTDKSAATKFCASLKANGQECIVIGK